ncbi:unnamed protein product [Schistosoma rodhaini]|uniref:Cadherin domain-containing protein n=1 Tax=Schistosoma rodhaini TaxID=6188 RepID=A0AA85FFN1_9TREM|nr:unnamed protein product [Schistosoma rodhaini]
MFLAVFFALILLESGTCIEFVFPCGQPKIYVGYLWINATVVHVIPRIQAAPDKPNDNYGKVCRFKIHSPESSLFYVELLDQKYGFAELRVDPKLSSNITKTSSFVLEIEASDCDEHSRTTSRVPIRIQVIDRHGPVFDKPHYNFKLGQRSPIGSIVGQIQAIEEVNQPSDYSNTAICSYRLEPVDSPFSINNYGVIRVRETLLSLAQRPYSLRVIAEDCSRPVPHRTSVSVTVEQILIDCKPGWKNLPSDIEFLGSEEKPERLFMHSSLHLETCTGPCANPFIETRLELRSAVIGQNLVTANPQSCRHDPTSIKRQQKFCGLDPITITNLLPDPEYDLVNQLIGPVLNSPPRLIPSLLAWRFDPTLSTVWEIDADRLFNNTRLPVKWDSDFTMSFWLRRHHLQNNLKVSNNDENEESIFCSHDNIESEWRYLSINLHGCRFVVRIMSSTSNEPKKSTLFVFDPLPEEICSQTTGHDDGIWHHYAITFSSSSSSAISNDPITILIDGQDLDIKAMPTVYESLQTSSNPFSYQGKPRLTIGACYDPQTHLTRQHLHGDLTGFTLLREKIESPNTLRCISQCGEALLIPNVMEVLCPDIDIHLENDVITVSGQNIMHLTDVLTSISYARPQPGVSVNYMPNVAQARLLKLLTSYRCSGDQSFVIPTAEIRLNVLPMTVTDILRTSHHDLSDQISQSTKDTSLWVPANMHVLDRPGLSQAIVGTRANYDKNSRPLQPPSLIILGSDIVTTEPPINPPGIPLFSDLRFGLPTEQVSDSSSSSQVAAGVPLDDCFVWLISTGNPISLNIRPKLYEEYGARIDWPVDETQSSQLIGLADRTGIQLRGRKPALIYANLLQKFRFWPPKNIRSMQLMNTNTEIIYMANIGLMCSLDSGKQTTPEFVVKIVIQGKGSETASLINEVGAFISNQSLSSRPNPDAVHYVLSDQERIESGDKSLNRLRLINPMDYEYGTIDKKPQYNYTGLVIGLSVSAVILVLLIGTAIWHIRKNKPQHHKKPTRRRRFASQPADFGGSNLKTDPTLRLTTNPVNDLQLMSMKMNSMHGIDYSVHSTPTRNHCIYSPPLTTQRINPFNNTPCDELSGSMYSLPNQTPRLADLEEFEDENYEYDDELGSVDQIHNPKYWITGQMLKTNSTKTSIIKPHTDQEKMENFKSFSPNNSPIKSDRYEWIDNEMDTNWHEKNHNNHNRESKSTELFNKTGHLNQNKTMNQTVQV